jgi:hypothetical protein
VDVDELIKSLEYLDRSELARLEEALRRRLRALGADGGGGEQPVSGVVEYRSHADGTLQAEIRRYYRKDGSAREQGPYWYFRYHEGGKQKKIYLGKTNNPESTLAAKRAGPSGEKASSRHPRA